MTTVQNFNEYTVQFNGKSTYFVINGTDCIGYFDTLRKAVNCMNKAAKMAGK